MYPVEGLAALTLPLGVDTPLPALLPETDPVGRLNLACSEPRLRIEDAALLASRELNPLV